MESLNPIVKHVGQNNIAPKLLYTKIVQNEFYKLILRTLLLPFPSCSSSTETKVKNMENIIDFPFHSADSKPHCVLRAIKVVKGDEKHIVVRFRHLQ